MKQKKWIVVGQYGGFLHVKGSFSDQREAMEFMGYVLDSDLGKPKRRGPRLICHVYELFGSYGN